MIRETKDCGTEEMNNKNRIGSMPSALRQSGIKTTEFAGDSLRLSELTGLAMARLHGQPKLAGKLPYRFDLPEKTGQARGTDPSILCLRPGEWLFINDTVEAGNLVQDIADEFGDEGAAVYDNSEGLAVIRLSGAGGPWLLSKLSGLDFLAGRSAGQHCARTKLGHMAVVIHYHCAGDGPFVFDLVCDRSLARYLWELLLASAPHADDLARAYGNAA